MPQGRQDVINQIRNIAVEELGPLSSCWEDRKRATHVVQDGTRLKALEPVLLPMNLPLLCTKEHGNVLWQSLDHVILEHLVALYETSLSRRRDVKQLQPLKNGGTLRGTGSIIVTRLLGRYRSQMVESRGGYFAAASSRRPRRKQQGNVERWVHRQKLDAEVKERPQVSPD